MSTYIEISGLTKTYKTPAGDFAALRGIDIGYGARMPPNCWKESGSGNRPTSCLERSPADSSSGWPSPAPWSMTRR
jgi:hypothetical protein